VPAAAVIPASVVYEYVVAVKTFVVELGARGGPFQSVRRWTVLELALVPASLGVALGFFRPAPVPFLGASGLDFQ